MTANDSNLNRLPTPVETINSVLNFADLLPGAAFCIAEGN